MTRYCASCGTEVDESAAFCPTCGQPLDQAAEFQGPPAPAWPAESGETGPAPLTAVRQAAHDASVTPMAQTEWSSPDSVPAPPAGVPASSPSPRMGPTVNLPLTWPVTLSGWLIGLGSVLAVVGIVIGLFGGVVNPIDLLLLLVLLGIAATVFLSARLPAIPQLRLVTFLAVLIGFGMSLERIAAGRASLGALLLFLGTAAAAIGAIVVELGQDQPVGGPSA